MEDSWTKLDGDSVEKEVMTVFKVMTKTSKVLANRDLPACSENCLSIKEEVRPCTFNDALSSLSRALEGQQEQCDSPSRTGQVHFSLQYLTAFLRSVVNQSVGGGV